MNDGDRDMGAVRDAIVKRLGGDALHRVIFTESHDADANGNERLPEAIWPGNAGSWFSRKRSTLAGAVVLSTPGIPMLFQGQEFLADAWFGDKIPLNWGRMTTYSGVWLFYRDMIALRRNRAGTTRGLRGQSVNVFHVNDADKVIAYHRWDRGGPGDDVVVLANFANRSYTSYRLGFPRPGFWRVRLNSDWEGYGNGDYANTPSFDTLAVPSPADGMPCSAELGIGPYTAVILSQDGK
jgi:1,4-alpha-glucan branching enzyme